MHVKIWINPPFFWFSDQIITNEITTIAFSQASLKSHRLSKRAFGTVKLEVYKVCCTAHKLTICETVIYSVFNSNMYKRSKPYITWRQEFNRHEPIYFFYSNEDTCNEIMWQSNTLYWYLKTVTSLSLSVSQYFF